MASAPDCASTTRTPSGPSTAPRAIEVRRACRRRRGRSPARDASSGPSTPHGLRTSRYGRRSDRAPACSARRGGSPSSRSGSTGFVTYSDAPAASAFSRSPFMAFAVSEMIGSSSNRRQRADGARRVEPVHLRHHRVHQDGVDVAVRLQSSRATLPFSAWRTSIRRALRTLANREDVAAVVVDEQHLLPREVGVVRKRRNVRLRRRLVRPHVLPGDGVGAGIAAGEAAA